MKVKKPYFNNSKIIPKTAIEIAIGSQTGDNTHHHDQVITLQSLRIMKLNNSNAGKPIVFTVTSFLSLIMFYYFIIYVIYFFHKIIKKFFSVFQRVYTLIN